MAILNDLGKIERDCRAARAARNDNGTIAIASILALTKKFPKIVLVFIVSAFVWGSLHAIMIKLPLSKLATESEAIVLADVLQVKCEWSWDRQLILSVVSLQVGEVLKGKLDQPEILIQVPGGTVGDIELRVSDMPDFTAGERVLVFLSEIPDRIGNRNSPSLSLFSTPAFQVFGFEDNTHPPCPSTPSILYLPATRLPSARGSDGLARVLVKEREGSPFKSSLVPHLPQ